MEDGSTVTSTPVTPAAAPAAPALLSPQEMSKEQWHDARLTGKFPTKADQPADSAPAQPVEQAASTDASSSPASEAGTPAKETKPRKNADTRVQELLRERAEERRRADDLQRRLEALERSPKPDAKPDSSTAAEQKAEWQRFAELPDAPKEDAFDRYGDYTAAMALYIADKRFEQRDQQLQQRTREDSQARHVEQVHTSAREKTSTYFEQHPDAKAKVSPELLAIPPLSTLDPRTVAEMQQHPEGRELLKGHWLLDRVLESDVPGPLLVHFSSEQGQRDWQRLTALPSSAAVTRALGQIEARLETPVSPVPMKSSAAPEPPSTLGKRPGGPVDELKAAQDSGDFRRFKAAYNAANASA